MQLLEDLRKVTGGVAVNELPTHTELPLVLAGLIKVLERAGLTVAEELIPKPALAVLEPAAAAALPAASHEALAALTALVQRAEHAAQALALHHEGPAGPAAPSGPPEPTPPVPEPSSSTGDQSAPAPEATPADAPAPTSSPDTPPAAPAWLGGSGPVAPPVEGAQ